MNTTLAVQVTQEDIDKGEAVDCFKCPIGRAVNRAFGNRGLSGPFSCYESIFLCLERGGRRGARALSDPNHDAGKWARRFDDFKHYEDVSLPQPAEFIFFLE